MSGASIREGVWTEPGSHREFYYRVWRSSGTKPLVIIIHGFGEYGDRYRALAEALAGEGMAVAVPDLWGHGRSQGVRGDAEGFKRYVEDLRALTAHVFLPESGRSRFTVYGHSFGALVAIHWALSHPPELARLIIQSPLLEVGFPIPPWKATAARWLGRWWPRTALPMNLDVQALSHDPAVANAYREDRWVHNRISARIYHGILQAGADALMRAHAIEVPTLVLYGEADRIVSIEAVRRWFNALRCQKRLVSFPEAYHELHHEVARTEVLRLIHEWTLAS